MVIHKKIAFSVVSFACALVMWQAMKNTCPPREQHLHAVTDVVERTVDRIFEERIQIPEESKQLAEYLSSKVIPEAVAKLTQQRIDFTNYGGVISVGSLSGEDGTPLSIGMFGKVFTTFSEDQAYDYINGLIDETDIENIIKNLNKENYGNQDIESDEGE